MIQNVVVNTEFGVYGYVQLFLASSLRPVQLAWNSVLE